ncbi:YktB family protein [Marinicrinis sediminis]|uniref:UPF0637 protein ACFSUC_01380 n=1 Tax=Marinicrinis sediminis TaxID=1652465 RepID=A0ABW5R5E5_9BACL
MFQGFAPIDFDTFHIEGLEQRMEAIQSRIQPKFQAIGEALVDDLSVLTGQEMHVHIAKHARRTVNPPKDTWMAFCHNKRGYKQHPHFQVGLFDDHLFVWLAYIYELPEKKRMAKQIRQQQALLEEVLGDEDVLSFDHMKKESVRAKDLTSKDLKNHLLRFERVKKAELLIGRHYSPQDETVQDGDKLLAAIKATYTQLLPIYKLTVGLPV